MWCDEVLIIDDNSTDKTVDIAKKHGAKVVTHALSDFASQRNFGLEQAKGEWIFFVDADERVSKSLRNEIQNAIRNEGKDGYGIRRVDYMWGKQLKYGEVGSIQLLRLARKQKGKWVGNVHEIWEINGAVGELSNPLYHYPHQTITEFLNEINFYSTLRAKELKNSGVKSSIFDIILYPKAKFFANYILKLGFLDGIAGLLFAVMMSLHSFLVRGKLWLLWQRKSGN